MSSGAIWNPAIVNACIVTLTLTFLFYVITFSPWLQQGVREEWPDEERRGAGVFSQTNKQILNDISGILLQTLSQTPFYNK